MNPDAARLALDAEIARVWPVEWRKANDPTRRNRSKARNNVRKRWLAMLELGAFRAANPDARCANCTHCKPYKSRDKNECHCELASDFYGYSLTKLDHVCTRWKEAQ
jgi:hypothetical protein